MSISSWLQNLSLRRKLTLATLLTTTLAVLAVCVVIAIYDLNSFRESTLHTLRSQGDIIAENVGAAIAFDDVEHAQKTLASLRAEDNIVAAAIFTAEGDLLATYFRNDPIPIPLPDLPYTHRFDADSVEVFRPIVLNQEIIGTVYLNSDLAALFARMRAYLLVMVGGIALGIAAATAMTFPLRRWLLDPMLHLARTADRVAETKNYSLRAVKRSDDELGSLIDRFNEMLDAIRQRDSDLEQAKHLAEEANRAKDRFLAVLSHELRTPLTPILLASQQLEQNPDLPQDLRADLEMIRNNVELEARLIDDLLDLTRIVRGRLQLDMQSVDAHELLERTRQMNSAEATERGITLTFELSATRHHVQADPVRLHQVYWNLLKNSLKFTSAGGRIDVRTADGPDHRMILTVTDTGVGIPPELLPRIFNAFEQAESIEGRKRGGLGLGLSIARAIVQAFGGTIAGHSEGEGEGATFTVELPTVEPTPTTLPQAPTGPPAEQTRSLRILLVEDHQPTLRIMTRLLRQLGHDVQPADSIRSAIHALGNELPFDLLISDLGLPDGSGYELMSAARQQSGPKIRGIAVSGYGMDADIARTKAAGFAIHLTKPVDIRRITSAIREAVDRNGDPTD